MMELGKKERHLISGLGVQVLLVGLLVFFYTQAARQLATQKERHEKLKEQVASAKLQAAKSQELDSQKIRERLEELQACLALPGSLGDWSQELKQFAASRFDLVVDQIRSEETSETTINVPVAGKIPAQAQLFSIEMAGSGATESLGQFLGALSDPAFKPLCVLEDMDLEATRAAKPIHFRLKWFVAASEAGTPPKTSSFANPPAFKLKWGKRQELFLSPLVDSSAISTGSDQFRLTGIVWDPEYPTCIIDGDVLKIGDTRKGYQVVLVTRHSVLLQKEEDEIILLLP